MIKFILSLVVLFSATASVAQNFEPEMIELDLGRKEGIINSTPVVLRSIVLKSKSISTDTALLFFRGWPGISRIESLDDWKQRGNLGFLVRQVELFTSQGISLVLMDCPSDQWGQKGDKPTSCNDDYKSSKQYASEVEQVMKVLSGRGITKFFIMGHSYGTIPSRWLAINLGSKIMGSIHSATMTDKNPTGIHQIYGGSVSIIDMSKIVSPYIYIHNADDQCDKTVYQTIKSVSNNNLVTVHGGGTSGDACGGRHYHSYEGRENVAAKAVVTWIKTGQITEHVGD